MIGNHVLKMATMSTVNSTRLEMLNKDNYDTWCIQVESLLIKNDLWGYVSGEIPRPREPVGTGEDVVTMQANLANWIKTDRKAKADLILSISPTEVKQVGKLSTSREVWLKLETIYASSGPARKATLLRQLTLHRMNEHEEVRDHINTFMDVVSKLDAMEIQVHDDLQAILLLNSLPESYENFCCAIAARDELPKPEILKIKIIDEAETRKQKHKYDDSGAMLARKGETGNSKEGGNHQNNTKIKRRFPFKCSRCGRKGHKAADCFAKDRDNLTNKASIADESFLSITGDHNDVFCAAESNTHKWCLDSGATSHLCKDRDTFESRLASVKN